MDKREAVGAVCGAIDILADVYISDAKDDASLGAFVRRLVEARNDYMQVLVDEQRARDAEMLGAVE